MKHPNKLYKAIDIWKRMGNGSVVRFRCFEILGENQFCVQSADFFHLPIDEKQMKYLDNHYIELFIEDAPDERSDTYPSLEEAIAAHEIIFFS